jgi:curved DNA-binding protein CbpA
LPDLYRALGANPATDADGLADAYRSAVRRAHPDVGGSHEQFVSVDLAWRLLGDPDTRRRFDALWHLQTATQSSSAVSDAEAHRLLIEADAAVSGWRMPVELRTGIDDLLDETRRWVQRREAASAGTPAKPGNAGHRSSGSARSDRDETEQMLRDSTQRLVAYSRESAQSYMAEWPDLLRRIRSNDSTKARQTALSEGYRTYISLRRLQDALDLARRYAALDADDLRLHLHASEAVLDVRASLIAAQSDLGRSYSFKNEKWLVDTRNRARRALDHRRVATGQPPWQSPAGPPTRDQNDDASGSSQEPNRPEESPRAHADAPPNEARLNASSNVSRSRAAGRPRWVGRVAVGSTTVAFLMAIWLVPEESIEVLTNMLAAVALAGLAWVLATSADARRLVGVLLVGMVKISWVILRGFVALGGILIGLALRRR